ncbi:MAG: response regulator, partial [Butyricicoccus sp.]
MYQVLLVDDDLIVRMFLKDVLEWEKFGFEVAGDARDGEEALELAQKYQPDLILTDISMPRMNGVELIRRLRADGYDGVLVALSCHDDFDLVKNALQSGADEYLLKNHINEDTVGVIMEKIRIQVEKRRQSADDRRQIQALAREGKKSRQRSVLAQLLSGVLNEDELPELLKEAGLDGLYRRCALVLFQPVGADGGQMRSLLELCTQASDAEIVELSPTIGVAILDLGSIPSLRDQEERVH